MNRIEKIYKAATAKGVANMHRRDSINWFKEYARKNVKQIDKLSSLGAKKAINLKLGEMYFFNYDAKYKDKLPYWDMAPLILLLDHSPTHIYGINLHYMAPIFRAKLLDKIEEILEDNSLNKSGQIFKLLSAVIPDKKLNNCVKLYLKSNIVNSLYIVERKHWSVVAFLPTARFVSNKTENVNKVDVYRGK